MVRGKGTLREVYLLYFVIILVVFAIAFGVSSEPTVSGAATAVAGRANVTILSQVAIALNISEVNFGSGYVLDACTSATLATDDSEINVTCWSNNTYIYNDTSNNVFIAENQGNQNATLKIRGGTAATFIGGTSPLYQWRGVEYEGGSCVGSLNSTYLNMLTTDQVVCSKMRHEASNDAIYVNIRIRIPEDVQTGDKSDVVTFTGSFA
jgi:hypothetical protein